MFSLVFGKWVFLLPSCLTLISGFSQEDIDLAVQLLLKLKVDFKQMTGQDYKAGCPPPENLVGPDNGPAAAAGDTDDDTVDPWNVSTTNAKGVDYDKLIGAIEIYTVQVSGVQAPESEIKQILSFVSEVWQQ